ncbi:hypothetical protein WICMUC_001944 [Wickerhamomyces mucosus]|uniref:Nudix hydrolase domain-containing protein n=1 Tax=Wickerhamomyces mucosus TaxID=1378264 RepID=A0A9P8PRE6_9ASCO|nr:hypothetical protein WICMUC_001944 [Wickerhamomyces mucosus]
MFTATELIANIRNYALPSIYPTQSIWPKHRRSAVMIILFIGNYGELRVLLTKRSRGLRAFSGHVSLPGGKADNFIESPIEIARRESFEEIGLNYDDDLNIQGLELEHLNLLPCYLSRTFLSVRPVVCFLKNINQIDGKISNMKFILNPGETSSIFSIPLLDLITQINSSNHEYIKMTNATHKWGLIPWPIQHYFYPTINKHEVSWLEEVVDLSSDEEIQDNDIKGLLKKNGGIKDVWGLTARILYDLALVSIKGSTKGTFTIGNENLIYGLTEFGGQMLENKRSDWESGMIVDNINHDFSQILPRYIFNKVAKEVKLPNQTSIIAE